MSLTVLHSSDWHLGQHFMNHSRASEHQAFFRWLIQTIEQESVDVLIIAGDIFDTGSPPSYARKLYNDFLVALHNTCCQQVIALAGNHDSVAVLKENQSLLAYLGIHVIGGVSENLNDHIIPLKNKDQSLAAVMMAVPFLRPSDISSSLPGQSADEKKHRLTQAIQSHYQQLYLLAQAARQGTQAPIISTGHLSVVGSKTSESVREIYIGQLDALPLSALPPVDYFALGHIHKPQCVGGHEHIRYSGSPIPLSFDETDTQKQVTLIHWDNAGKQHIRPLDIPSFRTLKSLKGSFESLKAQIVDLVSTQNKTSIQNALPNTSTPTNVTTMPLWLELIISDDNYSSHLQSQLTQLTEGENIELLRITREKVHLSSDFGQHEYSLKDLRPEDVFKQRLAAKNIATHQHQSLITAFKELLDKCDQPALEAKQQNKDED